MKTIEKYQLLIKSGQDEIAAFRKDNFSATKPNDIRNQMIVDAIKRCKAPDVQNDCRCLMLIALHAYTNESPLLGINWDDWYALIAGASYAIAINQENPLFSKFQGVKGGDRYELIPAYMEAWHAFFQAYENEKAKRFKVSSRVISILYALTQAIGAFFALMFCVLPLLHIALIPSIIIAVGLSLLSLSVNYDILVQLMKATLNRASAAFQSVTQRHATKSGQVLGVRRYGISMAVGGVIVMASAVTMGLLFYHSTLGILQSSAMHSSIAMFFTHGLVALVMPYAAVVVAVIVALVEGAIFMRSMASIVSDGGFFKGWYRLFKRTYDEIMMETRKSASPRLITTLAVMIFTMAVLLNITGILFLIRGGVSDLHQIAPMVKASYRWAWSIVAGIGMAFFFVKQAMGWSYDCSKAIANVPKITFSDCIHALKHSAIILAGLVAFGVCASMPAVGVAIGLAALTSALVLNRVVKKTVGKSSESDEATDLTVEVVDAVSAAGIGILSYNAPVDSAGVANAANLASGVFANSSGNLTAALAGSVGMFGSSLSNTHDSSVEVHYKASRVRADVGAREASCSK